MSADSEIRSAARQRLSALADGELDEHAVAGACAQWRNDGDVRATWHAYQLIGDVLRSDDLAGGARQDAAFLNALRARLAEEPVVLAPQAVEPAADASAGLATGTSHRSGRWGWMAPSAVAAGFVAVAGVLWVARAPDGPTAVATAAAPAARPTLASASGDSAQAAPAVEAQALVANGKFIRDVRLDRYLAAHKQFAGTSALGVPSGFLRSATVDAADK